MLIKQKKIMIGWGSNTHVHDDAGFVVLSEEISLKIDVKL
jgi:hypothetical protein